VRRVTPGINPPPATPSRSRASATCASALKHRWVLEPTSHAPYGFSRSVIRSTLMSAGNGRRSKRLKARLDDASGWHNNRIGSAFCGQTIDAESETYGSKAETYAWPTGKANLDTYYNIAASRGGRTVRRVSLISVGERDQKVRKIGPGGVVHVYVIGAISEVVLRRVVRLYDCWMKLGTHDEPSAEGRKPTSQVCTERQH